MEFKDNLRDSLKVADEIRKLKSEMEAKKIYLEDICSYGYHPLIKIILRALSNNYIDLEYNTVQSQSQEDYPYGYMILFKQLIIQIMKMSDSKIEEKNIIEDLFNNQLFTEGYLEYEELKTSGGKIFGWRIFISHKGYNLIKE